MTQAISRRGVLAAAGAMALPAAPAGAPKSAIKLTMPAPGFTDQDLNFFALLGVEWVTASGPGAPYFSDEGRVVPVRGNEAEPPWKEEQIRRLKDRVESFGLKLGNLMLHDFREAILGRPGAEQAIENVQESIRVAGKVGIPVVEYNWYGLRAMGGYFRKPGRGGSLLVGHDYDRSRNLPVLEDVGEHTAEQLWSRYERFLKAVVPVAERAGVRLAVHPNDPPVPKFRGVEQILGSVEGLRRVCETVRSPYNGITFDTGVTREMGADPVANIKWFGGRGQINHVHFRNVLLEVPRQKYTETFIDAGDNDMIACLRALNGTGYSHLLHPDHVPEYPGDPGQHTGWGYAVGQMKAMLRQL